MTEEDQPLFTKTYAVDFTTFGRLVQLAKSIDRSNSWVIRNLINREFEQKYGHTTAAVHEKQETRS